MDRRERAFAFTITGVHGADHLLKRLFPPLVPIWIVAFGFPLWQVGLLLGVRTFGSAIGQAPMGVLSDRYDRRYMLPAGMAVMSAAIVVFAVVPFLPGFAREVALAGYTADAGFLVMLAAMIATGVGSSVVHPTGYPLITANVRPEHKGKVLGMWGSASKFGDGLAPALVGVLLVVVGWTEILVAFGVLGVVYAGVLLFVLRPYDTRPLDTSDDDADGSLDVWRADRRLYIYPMLAVFVYFVVQIMAAGGVNAFLPEFINSVYGYSFSVAGFDLTPESTASFYYSALLIIAGIAQLGTGRLVDRFDSRVVLIAYLCAAAGLLSVLALAPLSAVGLFVVLGLLGATLWGMNPARDAIVSDIAPAEREGRTFGYLWTGALLAASGSPVVVGYIGDLVGLREAFALLAVAVLLSAAPIALLLSDRVYVDVARREAARAD